MKPRYTNINECMAEFNSLLRHLDRQNPKDPAFAPKAAPAPVAALTESTEVEARRVVKAERAHMSRYSSPQRAMDSFRVLAGLEESQLMPWNPGIVGETRTPAAIMEAAGIAEDEGDDHEYEKVVSQRQANYAATQQRPSAKPDMGGYSPRAAHKALRHSTRTISDMHAKHSYMHQIEPQHQQTMKMELAKRNMHASHMLRGAADGAPHDVYNHLHALAARHERHAKIYSNGGRPKLEAIEAIDELNEAVLDLIAE